ncbi:PH domain-containing protein, partial [Eubacterium limosum]
MALKDLMDKTSNLMEKTSKSAGGGIAQGLMGNAQEMNKEKVQAEYGMYLMSGETVKIGYQLLRDVFVVTDRRIIDFDKQGATGKKMSIKSIYLDSIVGVEAETA